MPQSLSKAHQTLTPQLTKEDIPPGEMRTWMSRVAALENPQAVLEQVLAGELPQEAIETLKARRPHLFAEWQGKVLHYLSEREDELPFAQVNLLSLLFDVTGDPSLEPATIQQIQAGHQQQPQQDPSKPGPKPTPQLAPELAATMQLGGYAAGGR